MEGLSFSAFNTFSPVAAYLRACVLRTPPPPPEPTGK